MELSRRRFVGLLAGAGISTLGSGWLLDRVLAIDAEGGLPVAPGPGIESWLPTACGMCQGGCGLEVRRIDGLPVGVRGLAGHPVNRGKLCPLPHGAIQMLFSPDRVRHPLKRAGRRGQGQWSELSWNDAIGMIEERLQTLLAAGSANRIAFLDGRQPGLGRTIAAGFMAGVGSPHHVAARETTPDEVARRMFGWDRVPGADLEHSRVVLLFRFDHLETDGSPIWQSRIFGQARDSTIDRPVYIGVGPRLFGSMAKCDSWLAARPGTEGVVALAMAHVILETNREDREFLHQYTDWSDSLSSERNGLRGLANALSPAVASEITGVPAAQIEQAARRFVDHQPGVALVGPGTPATPTSALTIAAVGLLNVLVGAIGKAGTLVERDGPRLADVWDSTAAPSGNTGAIGSPSQLARVLLENDPFPIDLLFLRDTNPVFDSPLASKFRRGLASNDRFVVAFSSELDETAMLADLVLPEPTFLERWDILTDTPTLPSAPVSLQQPAIAPLFSALQSEEVLTRVVNDLGGLTKLKFRATRAEELVRLAANGLSADERGAVDGVGKASSDPRGSRSEPTGFWEAYQERIVWSFRERPGRAGAPTQRITTLPGRLLALPEEPLDDWLRDAATPRNVGAADRYPFHLVVFRTAELGDGATTNVPMMMELAGHWPGEMWVTWAEMHPHTVAHIGVVDGDTVRIVSEVGHIDAVARISEATPPGLIAVPLGFGHEYGSTAARIGANVNLIVVAMLDPLREQTTRVNLRRA